MSDQPADDVVDQDVESDEVPLTPRMMAMMTITMFLGFVAFVAVCLPLFFFN